MLLHVLKKIFIKILIHDLSLMNKKVAWPGFELVTAYLYVKCLARLVIQINFDFLNISFRRNGFYLFKN